MGLPHSRDIEVDLGDGTPPVIISLIITREDYKKPYYGGYRHKVTGLEYHHAASQTEAPAKAQGSDQNAPNKFHRETQTKVASEKAMQAVRECGTQMARDDLHLEDGGDYVIEPREYLDSEEWERRRLEATVVIQCYTRGMFARTLARKYRYELAYNKQYMLEQQEKEMREREARRAREVERRKNPKTAADFEILYNELEQWRIQETQRIEVSEMSMEEKQNARYQLLLKEVKLVQTIDKLKASAQKNLKSEAIIKELEFMSKPKLWELSDGTVKEVITPENSRAKELSELYHGLNLSNLRVDERLDVLLHVKWTVKEFETKLAKELIELIDREADLLNRGRKEKALE
ncbi:hypothetical protein GUITHDRAFT_89024, partial [Guillardia theta CCMP2712]